jgi:hypothetical protein
MLFLYFPIDESQTARVSMGAVLETIEDEDEIDVRTEAGWFSLRRHPIADGWTCRTELGAVDASIDA